MSVKDLIRLVEKQETELFEFHKLVRQSNLDFNKIAKFLIRLERFRKQQEHSQGRAIFRC